MLDKTLRWSAWLVLGLLTLLTLLPLAPSGEWWVRIWDFPRVQIAALLLLPLGAAFFHAWRSGRRRQHAVVLSLVLAVALWQLWQVAPFTPLWPTETPSAEAAGDPALKLLTANLKYDNDRHAETLAMIRRLDADLVLLMEVDDAWAEALRPLDGDYPHRQGVVRGEGLGIVLWSRFPLLDSEVRHLVSERRPSVFATVDAPGIGPVRFVGVHPTPPGLRDRGAPSGGNEERRDSRVRDAELVLVAREVSSDPDQRWIVTGDFNDVAWSHTTRLFQDLSDLKDPRRGRWLMNTYHAHWPVWRFPIDHVFVSEGWRLVAMDRVATPGSDHFAITAQFNAAAKDDARPSASNDDKEEAEELVAEGKEDAAEQETAAGK
ncbi:Endonuclease/Exonuclease/phosphatase family protein [Pseudobythopirellula maris]|uniref:Endonuclease/Exonuclease/phosphatase family protein n=1 Tax=Pseudobythopirellula maris TaxID=2527991 RepID=A0A5C5ZTQ5_9BACT|nr:endonuclease/exonuclease/phosphatase family protein [Pseudobythopirellula maris]TWT90912.1 Endonuclease/Exonuclease/phosphatase family protein [Pseudobythopirellula maris]